MPLFLLGYDIADPKRLQRIHRAVVRHATPIQHSVFLLEDAEAVSRCLAVVLPLIDPNADDVRVYPLPHSARWYVWASRLFLRELCGWDYQKACAEVKKQGKILRL